MGGRFVLAGEMPVTDYAWGAVAAVSRPDVTGARALTILEARFAPGKGHAFHQHPEQEEMLVILEGRVEQWIEREHRILGPGDAAFIPKGVVHASFTVGDSPARLLAIFGPSVGPDGSTVIEMAEEEPWRSLRPASFG